MDENATSSSRSGAMPVHSESRQPMTSSSSASPSSSSRSMVTSPHLTRALPLSSSFTGLLQAGLDRVAVDAAVLEIELVRPVLDAVDRVARHEPQRNRLAAAPVLLARPRLRELHVGRDDRAGVLERLTVALSAKDLVDHAARTESRTHCSWSRNRRRNARRSSVFGPCPVTTCLSSSQSGSLYSHVPSSRRRSFGSGPLRPSSQICGT